MFNSKHTKQIPYLFNIFSPWIFCRFLKFLKNVKSPFTIVWNCLHAVVCLRGGERGSPPSGFTHVNFLYFWWKTYYSLINCTTKQIISKYSAFKGDPYRNCNVQILCFQRGPNSNCNLKGICFQSGPQQPLKCVSTLLLNIIEGAPERNCNVQVLCFQRVPYRSCNVQVLCFQGGPQQPLKCVSTLLLNFIKEAVKKL